MNRFELQVIGKLKSLLKKEFPSDPTGHDFWHFERVRRLSKRIVREEGRDVNMFVIELGALLHDVGDWKFNSDEKAGGKKARSILLKMNVSDDLIKQVMHIVDNVSFKGAKVKNKMKSLEGKIVQDADRLDAMGAIGIARIFATGTYMKYPIHDPKIKPVLHNTFKKYKKGSTSINHFYEKIFLLKDMMNTKTARKLAKERHTFMEKFLKKFLTDWTFA